MFDADDIDTSGQTEFDADDAEGETIERYEGEEQTEGVDAALDAFLDRDR